ncbi:flagellar protein FliS [Alteraurantiacibacter aquimixticola]|uniref:Flagellar protein FliS n=1 Tax=Alteraurantiacibacter aquimixticola TaxID=2489173 RepID=A0A4T3F761_9SPHN|nr:flagellar protein FliS [Alteraurantiacibacter aquimixticola]TIX51542.1 hypothetical protein E5222_03560 [Alteraurantiacibacter aquimixticola]
MLKLADPAATYRRVAFDGYVSGCGGTQLVRLCLEDLAAAMQRAIWGEANNRRDIRTKALSRAQLGLVALLQGIDPQQPLADVLETFYRGLMQDVTACQARFDAARLSRARQDVMEVTDTLFATT